MRSVKFVITCFLFFISIQLSAQKYSVEGKVYDKDDNTVLSYANIRVLGTMQGSTTNINGEYMIPLGKGNYTLVASYIGYFSDTVTVNVSGNIKNIDFKLSKSSIEFPAVVVRPGINPALAIVKKAIDKKEERSKKINSYKMDIYTKGIFRSNKDDIDEEDSTKGKIKIVGILENTGVSYFEYPDKYKDIITARKQTANFPPEINILIGSRMMQSFYENEVKFFDISIPGPLNTNALEYYDYYIVDTLSIDNNKIYKLRINTLSEADPGFSGEIYILDKSFDLIKVEVNLNRAANIGGLFDSINIYQQFSVYDSVYMPVDYRIALNLNLFGLIKLEIDLNSVMYDYSLNNKENENIFNKAVVTVLPDADVKDTTYWMSSRFIPNTLDEKKSYTRMDSIAAAPKTFWQTVLISLAEGELKLNKNFSVSTPLNMYHFNRVEGHSIDFGIKAKDYFDKRLNSKLNLHYGFADKKFKTEFSTSFLLGSYRTYEVSLNLYKGLSILFNESNEFSNFTSSLFSLAFNNDFLNYYYSDGFDIKLGGEVFPILKTSIGCSNRTDNNARKNSDFSFSDKNKVFKENPPVNETKLNIINFDFDFDFRDYIEDGYFRIRDAGGESFINFGGGISYSSNSFLESSTDFLIYKARISGKLNSFRMTDLDYKVTANYSKDKIPVQLMYALPGTAANISGIYSFRTIKYGEYFGNQTLAVNLNYNFYDDFFRLLPLPYIKDWNIVLSAFFNAGWTNISDNSKTILPVAYELLKKPLLEKGLGIGYSIIPIKLEFAWRLTHKNENSFTVGLNTAILLK